MTLKVPYDRKGKLFGFQKECDSLVQKSRNFHTKMKAKKSDFWEKSDFSNFATPKEPRNPIFGKNRISKWYGSFRDPALDSQ
jgi:hypothetical protein